MSQFTHSINAPAAAAAAAAGVARARPRQQLDLSAMRSEAGQLASEDESDGEQHLDHSRYTPRGSRGERQSQREADREYTTPTGSGGSGACLVPRVLLARTHTVCNSPFLAREAARGARIDPPRSSTLKRSAQRDLSRELPRGAARPGSGTTLTEFLARKLRQEEQSKAQGDKPQDASGRGREPAGVSEKISITVRQTRLGRMQSACVFNGLRRFSPTQVKDQDGSTTDFMLKRSVKFERVFEVRPLLC
jgi:hypothetical protein